ncbi:MAG: protein-L-isoaspartate(D-aspartate) O-methyltransferase [Gammaproteobacteria bacterium]|nr:MAG: protein-L-isoaspartate(D-aspartate) O-methyltransferase [Gammaproteobacteria bacterium]
MAAGHQLVGPRSGIGMTSQRTRDRLIERLRKEGIRNETVLSVMRTTPRHLFMDEAMASRAYEDIALPIGYSQTISQPFVVARMTELLLAADIDGGVKKLLEVGTGSGYQAAILSQLVGEVFSVDRIEPLINQARQRFFDLKYNNIRLKHADGNWGWPEKGPYDGIMVTAAAPHVPQSLLDQLVIGARLVIPVGESDLQQLMVLTRTQEGFDTDLHEYVSFVPLLAGTH